MFYDTGGYLVPLFDREPFLGRSALYGAFLALGIPFDFWPNVVIQAVLSGWLVILTLRAHGFGRSLAGVLAWISTDWNPSNAGFGKGFRRLGISALSVIRYGELITRVHAVSFAPATILGESGSPRFRA
jgi:hypothetical protein